MNKKAVIIKDLNSLSIDEARQRLFDCKKIKEDMANTLMNKAQTIEEKASIWLEFANKSKVLDLYDLDKDLRDIFEKYVSPEKYQTYNSFDLKSELDYLLENEDITKEEYNKCLNYIINENIDTLEWYW